MVPFDDGNRLKTCSAANNAAARCVDERQQSMQLFGKETLANNERIEWQMACSFCINQLALITSLLSNSPMKLKADFTAQYRRHGLLMCRSVNVDWTPADWVSHIKHKRAEGRIGPS